MTETYTFRVIAQRETEYWDETFRKDNRIEEVLTLYLIRPGEATHICSLTPNSRVMFLCRVVYTDACLDGLDRYENLTWRQNKEIDSVEIDRHEEELTNYIGFVDFTKLDARWAGPEFSVTADELELRDDQTAADAAWDWAYGVTEPGCNDSPLVADSAAVFLAWQADDRARLRAVNERPLAGRETLPLFVTAANRHYDTVRRRYDAATAGPWSKTRDACHAWREDLQDLGWA